MFPLKTPVSPYGSRRAVGHTLPDTELICGCEYNRFEQLSKAALQYTPLGESSSKTLTPWGPRLMVSITYAGDASH
jgi:hypothetical protein